ncbi:MAG: hypothetical protein ACRDLP_12805 [Solirubrobacteraceae bacterium]
MASRKELGELLEEAERQGWRIEHGRGGHYKAYAPDGKSIVTLPSTPGGSLAPYVARMRRIGFTWKGR